MNKESNGWQVMVSNEVLSMYRQNNNKNNKNAVGQSFHIQKELWTEARK